MSLDVLNRKLRDHIVRQDRKDDERAMRSGRYHNPHALALMLEAAERVESESAGGTQEDWIRAVSRNFTVSRTMHTFLKKIDPAVDVDHGHWGWVWRKR